MACTLMLVIRTASAKAQLLSEKSFAINKDFSLFG
jgi:hypothetical protein